MCYFYNLCRFFINLDIIFQGLGFFLFCGFIRFQFLVVFLFILQREKEQGLCVLRGVGVYVGQIWKWYSNFLFMFYCVEFRYLVISKCKRRQKMKFSCVLKKEKEILIIQQSTFYYEKSLFFQLISFYMIQIININIQTRFVRMQQWLGLSGYFYDLYIFILMFQICVEMKILNV